MKTRRRAEDYPPHIQKQIKAALDTAPPAAAVPARRPSYVPGEMNETERECLRLHIPGECDVEFEGERIELAQNSTYLPDFRVTYPDGRVEFWEVKGAYVRGDSREKFLHAVRARADSVFVWARKKKAGWKIERWKMRRGMPRKEKHDAAS